AGEADEHRARLIARRVVVDDELELRGLLADFGAFELAQRDRRQEDFVADAAALEDDAILELASDVTAERGNHPNSRAPGLSPARSGPRAGVRSGPRVGVRSGPRVGVRSGPRVGVRSGPRACVCSGVRA